MPPQGGRKHPQQEFLQVDTTNILFICGGAFAGLEQDHRRARQGLGRSASAPRCAAPEDRRTGEILREVEPEDLLKFGLIPEFVGRLPVVATLEDLDEEALIEILTEPKNALVKQYQRLFEMEDVEADLHRGRAARGRPQGHRAQDRRARPALDHGEHPARHHVRAARPRRRRARSWSTARSSKARAQPLYIYGEQPAEQTLRLMPLPAPAAGLPCRPALRRNGQPCRRGAPAWPTVRAGSRRGQTGEEPPYREAVAALQRIRLSQSEVPMHEPRNHAQPLRAPSCYPVLPLRDIVVFPHMIVPLFVGREKSVRALEG